MPTVLLTGSNRGLGLEFARQYAADGWRVVATCRNPATAEQLNALDVEVEPLDVSDFDAIAALAARRTDPIDVLLCNAGVYPDRRGLGSIDYGAWADAFRVNSMAPLRCAECFLDAVRAGEQRKIVAVTSKMGSIADNTSGGSYIYRSSKTALNMAFRSLSLDLAGDVSVCVLHPGWVATDMGGASAPMQIPDSVSGMRQVIADLTPERSGGFYLHDGSPIPW